MSPLWLLPWSAQTLLPLEAQILSSLSSLITAKYGINPYAGTRINVFPLKFKLRFLLFAFQFVQDYVVNVTDEFLEFISDGALAIEVWGHRCAGNGRALWELDAMEAKTQTLRDRYNGPLDF